MIKKNESKIQDFQSFLLNEDAKTDIDQETASKVIEDVISGKIKPIEVSPKDSRNSSKLSFQEPDDNEEGSKNEEVTLYLPNEASIDINFSWSYDFIPGTKSSNYDIPDDPDEYQLDSLEIDEVNYYYNNGEDKLKVELTPKVVDMLKDYFEQFIQVSDQTNSYARSRKIEKAKI
jgi:hypothetical protein